MDTFEATVTLSPGDQLILYTDGIVEASAPDRELFGVNRLDAVISACKSDPQEIINSVIAVVKDYTHDAAASDDRTLVVCKIDG